MLKFVEVTAVARQGSAHPFLFIAVSRKPSAERRVVDCRSALFGTARSLAFYRFSLRDSARNSLAATDSPIKLNELLNIEMQNSDFSGHQRVI